MLNLDDQKQKKDMQQVSSINQSKQWFISRKEKLTSRHALLKRITPKKEVVFLQLRLIGSLHDE